MNLNRKNITMAILSKFIENNMEKIENASTKANNIRNKKVKIRTSRNYKEENDENTYLLQTISSKDIYNPDFDL